MSGTTQTQVALYLSADLAERLRAAAERQDITQQELLRRAVARILDVDHYDWFMPMDVPPEKMVEGARAYLADRAAKGETVEEDIQALDAMLRRLGWQRQRGLPEVGELADEVKADFDAKARTHGIVQAQADSLWEAVVELWYARTETSKIQAWKAALASAAEAHTGLRLILAKATES